MAYDFTHSTFLVTLPRFKIRLFNFILEIEKI